MSNSCIFCKIIKGEIPATRVFENDEFFCIKDLQPQAKVHLLVLPKQHVASLEAAFPAEGGDQAAMVGRLMATGTWMARQQGLLPGGFRSVINTNADGGQTVFHLHLHILGGEPLRGKLA